MFYLPPDRELEDTAGRFPLTRAEIQPAMDDVAEIETTWWEPGQVDEWADRQDARIREVTGQAVQYPRHSHKRALGYEDVRGVSVGAELGQGEPLPDPRLDLDAYNEAVKRLREVTPELSDIKTTDEAELSWLEDAQKKRQAAAEIATHSSESLAGPASLARMWAGVKTGVQEPANIAAMGLGVVSGGALAGPLAGASLFARLGTPVLLDSLYGAGAQYSISDRLEQLRLRLGYTPEQVQAMKWEETATAFGMGAVLGGLFEAGSLGVRTMLRGSGKVGAAIDDLNSPDPATRLKAADEIERSVPLNDEEAALLAAARRDANLRLNAPVHAADLRSYLGKLEGARGVAAGADPDPGWFVRMATHFDAESPRMQAIRRLTDSHGGGETVTLNEIRDVLTPAQKIAFERDLNATPKAETVREVVFDFRDLSPAGKKLFKDIERFADEARTTEGVGAARRQKDILAKMDAASEADRKALARFRDAIERGEIAKADVKRRIVEERQQTERRDVIQSWMQTLRREADDATARVKTDAERAKNPANPLARAEAREVLPAILARRAPVEQRPPITNDAEAKQAFQSLQAGPKVNPDEIRIADDMAAGKYDDALSDSEGDLVARFGDEDVTDPLTGETRKLRDIVDENNANIAGLRDIFSCMNGLARAT